MAFKIDYLPMIYWHLYALAAFDIQLYAWLANRFTVRMHFQQGQVQKQSSSTAMDDVDRLFECFKCGVSPPQSAMRERKISRSRFKQEAPMFQGSTSVGTTSSLSAAQNKQNTSDVHLRLDRVGSVINKANEFNAGKLISPIVFYGSPHGVPPKRPSSMLRLLREIRVDLAEKHKSNLRKEIWATFPRQEEATKFAEERGNVHVFSYQDHFSGQRRFLVSTYKEFWRRYKNMDPKFRHHYEVIQEGLPCHLYFDLEFNKRENADKNGDQMIDLLISVIFEALLEKYSLQCNQNWVVELDSSTEEKFSRHLVIRIPRAAFKDNSHAGAFVAEVCSRIHNATEKDTRFEQLFISKNESSAGPSVQLFVDKAVYSRNRCFRLALSSKAGKNSMLLPTGRFMCEDMCEEDMFWASLICGMDDDCEKLLVCKMELDCVKTLQFDTEVNYSCRKSSTDLQAFASTICTREILGTYMMGKSPFPALDAFIESVATVGDVSGKIRSWYWFSEYGLMVYSMSRNRYCERIGRQHKSNHVMYVVDLQWALYYQKCYDPDCKGYRSPSRPVPLEDIPETFSSGYAGYGSGSAGNVLKFAETEEDKGTRDGFSNHQWWLEAIKVAETVESMGNFPDFKSMENVSDEDKEWWMEAERTASQAEL
ncbi:hypothetical protein Nepgr_010790 [Nepenthes gracilis]|uniref:DNA-directed primase/polymerase protein n=1 Tax=Nepenthes gracilis TaxID=150966 RepID=A0AAD3SDX2_NEPGR|nr:hypothetical protein Nepgr_010790 [Nepenthes gracilis]